MSVKKSPRDRETDARRISPICILTLFLMGYWILNWFLTRIDGEKGWVGIVELELVKNMLYVDHSYSVYI